MNVLQELFKVELDRETKLRKGLASAKKTIKKLSKQLALRSSELDKLKNVLGGTDD